MMTPAILLSALLATSVADQLDGTEIGDATQYVAFQSHGKYVAEREDKAGKTSAKGTWAVDGDKLEVKVTSCRGPACKSTLGKGYTANLHVVAERAMTVKAAPDDAPLGTGSYYCRYQGCERRSGVQLVSFGAKAVTMKYLVDFLIDKNRSRDVTVVWWGKKAEKSQPVSTIRQCARDPERAKKTAELVTQDLATLTWVGKLKVEPVAEKDCLWDVQVTIGDEVMVPPRSAQKAK